MVVGLLGATQLAAHVTTFNLLTLLFMPTVSLSGAASTIVGNSIGEMRPRKSCQAAWTATALDFVMSPALISPLILISWRKVDLPGPDPTDLLPAHLLAPHLRQRSA